MGCGAIVSNGYDMTDEKNTFLPNMRLSSRDFNYDGYQKQLPIIICNSQVYSSIDKLRGFF